MKRVMPRKKLAAFRLDPELIEGLQLVKAKTGAPIAEQVRRAIVAWLRANGLTEKADRKRSGARKRP
jgi:predicted DNA-binding protein